MPTAALTSTPPRRKRAARRGGLPGGGYTHLAWIMKASRSRVVNARGIGHSCCGTGSAELSSPIELGDAQRALRMVRALATEFHVAPTASASGGSRPAATWQLRWAPISTRATRRRRSAGPRELPARLMILAYPVISMSAQTRTGSALNLLGDSPDPHWSIAVERKAGHFPHASHVPLPHGCTRVPVDKQRDILPGAAQGGLPAGCTLRRGNHGVGLAQKDPVLSTWPDRLADWLRNRGRSAEGFLYHL